MMLRLRFLLLLLLPACGGSGGAAPPADPQAPHASTQLVVALKDPDDDEGIEDLRKDAGGVAIERIGDSHYYVLQVPEGTDLEDLLDELDTDLRVEDIQLNYLGGGPEGGPSDAPTFGDDDFASIPFQPALAPLGLDAAHASSTGAGIVVAVVDTGVDASHPFLAGRTLPGGFDFVDGDLDPSESRNLADDDGDGRVDDQYGHGTFVASLVLVAAPGARILPVRVLDDEGNGTVAAVSAGILHAVDAGARVINVSVDIPQSAPAVEDAIDRARDRGVLVVAAAGNEGMNQLIYPARYSGVLAVTALQSNGVVAPFANRDSRVALSAPGVALLGAFPLPGSPSGTARWSGTSFAAPIVAGSAALVMERFPGLRGVEVRDLLRETATSVDGLNPGLAGKLGSGRVDPAAAVQ
jgi:subtilisin family serine protease